MRFRVEARIEPTSVSAMPLKALICSLLRKVEDVGAMLSLDAVVRVACWAWCCRSGSFFVLQASGDEHDDRNKIPVQPAHFCTRWERELEVTDLGVVGRWS